MPDLYGEVTDVRHPMATPASEPLTSRSALREAQRDCIDPIRTYTARGDLDLLITASRGDGS
ncbi:hypothetical protein [Streptomyces sp. NPDC001843]|uniref:hypothetical protein n=1 Tax=Streptomyces sp. NPDC001843 TaxID=3364617 RepID=UPI0036BD0DBE